MAAVFRSLGAPAQWFGEIDLVDSPPEKVGVVIDTAASTFGVLPALARTARGREVGS